MNYFKSHLSAFFFFAVASTFLVSCEDNSKLPPTNYCGDNIMNFGETGVDCGGPCWPCDPSCSDGIQNGSETGVDCGGSCAPCAVTSSCTDGVMNGDETGIDCGGSCPDVCPEATCTDGIMNGDETGVDCGGSCPDTCPLTGEYMTADINGAAFNANLVSGAITDGTTTIAFQSDQSQDEQMFFEVPTATDPGTYDLLSSGFLVTFAKVGDGVYTTGSGTITITTNDNVNQELYGTFEFTATEYDVDGVTVINTVVITNGTFGVEYF